MILMDTKRVKELTGLTDNQITYLINNIDALKREKTQGKARDYSFRDLVYLKLASVMRADGGRLPVINEAIKLVEQYWINENPKDAGTLLRMYLDNLGYFWTWSPNFDEKYDVDMVRVPKLLYNVAYYAMELAKLDQLELDIMTEEMAVQN